MNRTRERTPRLDWESKEPGCATCAATPEPFRPFQVGAVDLDFPAARMAGFAPAVGTGPQMVVAELAPRVRSRKSGTATRLPAATRCRQANRPTLLMARSLDFEGTAVVRPARPPRRWTTQKSAHLPKPCGRRAVSGHAGRNCFGRLVVADSPRIARPGLAGSEVAGRAFSMAPPVRQPIPVAVAGIRLPEQPDTASLSMRTESPNPDRDVPHSGPSSGAGMDRIGDPIQRPQGMGA